MQTESNKTKWLLMWEWTKDNEICSDSEVFDTESEARDFYDDLSVLYVNSPTIAYLHEFNSTPNVVLR
ncbi:hypothetical protein [Veillonella sp. R32]|uniref:hypothetical protein n=1 Tax=Veillonella sp. R32 TaxID=2021312 RepID=UPI001389D87F|nr:hypothetical protein [Veillonella sp. R32]KAF1682590.1 hypothetical protein VER_05130 [Veillonella sp. R32]